MSERTAVWIILQTRWKFYAERQKKSFISAACEAHFLPVSPWNFRRSGRTIGIMLRRCSLMFVVLIFSQAVIAGQIESLIQSLGDPSPMKRSESEMELAHLGAAARPALIDASRWDDPAISSAATRVLLSLPWDKPDDPAEVKALLVNYGGEDEMGRMRIAAAIFEKGPAIGAAPLLRLVMEDPSEDVCWE